MSPSARMFESGEAVPGTKYRVVRQLGAGGMGIVYQVEKPPQIGGVLKLMAADLAVQSEFRTRFFDEVRVLAQLDHPNIVRVFDYDALYDGTPFYVMEMLHGRTVREVLDSVGRVPPRVAFEITRQLLEALHCAHTNAIPVVHRDIKPENIFLHAPRHGDPVVKLIDFGVVAIADRAHDGTFVGTWKYAAPEQIRGERATPATDLYAVGLVLYEMLGGAGPFDRYETGPAVAEAHVRETPPPVSLLAPWVPPSITQLISSALAKAPAARPRDAYAFAEKLFELQWASDGDDAREGGRSPDPIARVLTDVGLLGPGQARRAREPKSDTFAASHAEAPLPRPRARADLFTRALLPLLAVLTAATVALAVVLVVRARAARAIEAGTHDAVAPGAVAPGAVAPADGPSPSATSTDARHPDPLPAPTASAAASASTATAAASKPSGRRVAPSPAPPPAPGREARPSGAPPEEPDRSF
jgi:serine/threonine protein kinase